MAENKDIIKLSDFKKTIIVVDEIQENGNYQPETCQNAYDPNKVSMYVDQQKNETLMSNYYTIEEIEEILSGKTNIDSVYTKDETYNKNEVYNVGQIDFLLKSKANKVDVYSKIDINTLLDVKANKNEVYDKNEIDEILNSYYTKLDIDTILENKADTEDVIAISGQVLTNTEDIGYLQSSKANVSDLLSVSGQVSENTEDIENLQSNKANTATTLSGYGITDAYTKTESDNKYETIENVDLLEGIVSGNTEAIENLQSNKADTSDLSSLSGQVLVNTEAIENLQSNKADTATTLSGYGITDAYTKTEINNKISAVFRYKGSVATYTALTALTGMTVGDVYNVTETGDNYAWTGTEWDKLAGEVDLSAYLTIDSASNIYETIENVNLLEEQILINADDISDLQDNKADKISTLVNVPAIQVSGSYTLLNFTQTNIQGTLLNGINVTFNLPTPLFGQTNESVVHFITDSIGVPVLIYNNFIPIWESGKAIELEKNKNYTICFEQINNGSVWIVKATWGVF